MSAFRRGPRGKLLLELRDPAWPVAAFVEHSLAGGPTNWWVPTEACVEAMVRTTGLRVVERPSHEIFLYRRGGYAYVDELGAVRRGFATSRA
jgi:hypothetical protein